MNDQKIKEMNHDELLFEFRETSDWCHAEMLKKEILNRFVSYEKYQELQKKLHSVICGSASQRIVIAQHKKHLAEWQRKYTTLQNKIKLL